MRRSLTALISAALVFIACGSDGADPAATIEAYIDAYNGGDLDGVMALFAEDAVLTGHPFADLATGRSEIRVVHAREVDGANSYTISNVEVSGNTVTWDHEWNTDNCVTGHSALIEDRKISSWTWPVTDFQC